MKLWRLPSTILSRVVRTLMSVTIIHMVQRFCNGIVKWMHIFGMVRDFVLSMFLAVPFNSASPCIS